MTKIIKIGIFLIINIFVLSGCVRLDFIDKKLGEIFFNASSTSERADFDFSKEKAIVDSKNLIKEQKDKIDAWLEENELNRYGDLPGTYYASGTPLFDKNGAAIERYEYILMKHSELSKILGNKQ